MGTNVSVCADSQKHTIPKMVVNHLGVVFKLQIVNGQARKKIHCVLEIAALPNVNNP